MRREITWGRATVAISVFAHCYVMTVGLTTKVMHIQYKCFQSEEACWRRFLTCELSSATCDPRQCRAPQNGQETLGRKFVLSEWFHGARTTFHTPRQTWWTWRSPACGGSSSWSGSRCGCRQTCRRHLADSGTLKFVCRLATAEKWEGRQ